MELYNQQQQNRVVEGGFYILPVFHFMFGILTPDRP
jgi:hypothetical protein